MGRGRGSSAAAVNAPNRGLRRKTAPDTALVSGTPFNAEELAVYTDALLDSAGVSEGDVVSCKVAYPSQLWMADALADAARARNARFEAMCDEGAFEDPGKMPGLIERKAVFMDLSSFSPSEAAAGETLPGPYAEDWAIYDDAMSKNEVRWNVAMSPNKEWATSVYPELDEHEAYRQLGQDLLSFMRQGSEDAEDAWKQHMDKLQYRSDTLNELGIKTLKFVGGGTSLSMSTLDGGRFLPVQWDTEHGDQICVNSPTEEVFTTPNPAEVEGTFEASKPLVLGGMVIDEIRGEIKGGKLVSLTCGEEEKDRVLHQTFLESAGMSRLGEVGLVDQQGPIAQCNRTYFNNIIDENAGTHLGFGNSYDIALTDSAKANGVSGNTGAASHLDIVIGDSDMDVIGVDEDGCEIPLIFQGKWQF